MPFDQPPYRETVRRKPRTCLCCAQAFDSAWAGERICVRCKGSSTWREDIARGGSNHGRYEAKMPRKMS
jgi:hypothetical protein